MPDVNVEAMTNDEMVAFIREQQIPCPGCGKSDFTDIRKFNLMFKTFQGVTEDTAARGVPAPGDRTGHFRQLQERPAHDAPQDARSASARSARASATRSRRATSSSASASLSRWSWSSSASRARIWSGSTTGRSYCHDWLLGLGMQEENLRLRDHEKEELSHLLQGHDRHRVSVPVRLGRALGHCRPHGLRPQGSTRSTPVRSMDYFDQETNEHYVPYVIEPSLGADRVALAFLCEAYDEEVVDEAKNDTRVVLHLHPALAPVQVRGAAAVEKALRAGDRALPQAAEALHVRLRRRRLASASATAVRTRSARRTA